MRRTRKVVRGLNRGVKGLPNKGKCEVEAAPKASEGKKLSKDERHCAESRKKRRGMSAGRIGGGENRRGEASSPEERAKDRGRKKGH